MPFPLSRAAAFVLALMSALPAAAERAEAAECGRASWYALTGRTASGMRADPTGFYAAHRTLPFGTRIRVENLHNGRVVEVRVNDRGPFVRGRIVDVTKAAAAKLGFISAGTAPVRVTVVGRETAAKSC
ncbi:septal ring lytic transglycosylase RlpA family protein [Microbaculum sp. FT89]|uniref:septal ring lytic transglycosylase RlpA family protein n=1 Tax=Microbaculum sp. FT89 TaxID=3447298 RepID=UPI003F5308B8